MIFSLALVVAIQRGPSSPRFDDISAKRMMTHVRVLASDRFEGRGPTSRGEQLTVAYLTSQFKKIGLEPGNPNGTYVQSVPLVGYRTRPKLAFNIKGKSLPVRFPEDFIHEFPQLTPHAGAIGAPVVFAGYGIVAPEFDWNDYKGADVTGKIVLVLGGEPSRPDPKHIKNLDARFFRGDFRTRYSMRDYKAECLRKMGAASVIFLASAESPKSFTIYKTFAVMEGLSLPDWNLNEHKLITTGVLHPRTAERIFRATGFELKDLKRQANSASFKPVALDATADLEVDTSLRPTSSQNVVGIVRGSDPDLRNEFVVVSAHWDHLGKDPNLKGDQIYNGAIDDGIGVSQLLEIARSFKNLKVKPKRSILFIATTSEEKGWLGSKYYVQFPLYPLNRHVANINLDGGNAWGRTRDLIVSGYGLSTLDRVLGQAARAQGRKFLQGSIDDDGLYFGSDQIEFARGGIPAAFPFSGSDYIGKPKGFGDRKWSEYADRDYHQVSDDVKPDWDFSGAAQDAGWLAIAAYKIADEVQRPRWLPGAELVVRRLIP